MDVSVIGTIYDLAVFDDSGNVIKPAVKRSGYHVNTTSTVEGLEPYQVFPKTPHRVFGGADTFHYVFKDISEFNSLMSEFINDAQDSY